MYAERGAKGAELEPAGKEFLILRISRITVSRRTVAKKPAGICVPIRNAGHGEIEPGGNLVSKDLPRALDVARPGNGTVALLTGVGRAGEDHNAFVISRGALSLINAGRV